MTDKPRIVIESYDPQERIIEGIKIETNNTGKRFREKGLSIEEFKKAVRKKLGDSVDIENNVKKQRVIDAGKTHLPPSGKPDNDQYSMRDIMHVMKNGFSD
jgi:hypothetical protein